MEINAETFKKPQTWSVLAPAILMLMALYLTLGMMDAKTKAGIAVGRTQSIVKTAGQILDVRRKAEQEGIAARKIRPYDTVNSALEAAGAAAISDKKIHRGVSPSPTRLKDGSYQYRETYKINAVMMFQLARFIDYAEQNFESVRCVDVTIVPSPDLKNKDSWDANINFIYIKQP